MTTQRPAARPPELAAARRGRRARPPPRTARSIRVLDPSGDRPVALERARGPRLRRRPRPATVIGAEVDGRLVAALSISTPARSSPIRSRRRRPSSSGSNSEPSNCAVTAAARRFAATASTSRRARGAASPLGSFAASHPRDATPPRVAFACPLSRPHRCRVSPGARSAGLKRLSEVDDTRRWADDGSLRTQASEGDTVSATVLYMSMSLDGFIAGPNERPDNGLGDGGHRLHEWALTGTDGDHKEVGPSGGRQPRGLDEMHGHRGGRRRPGDLRAGGRLGRRPPRRRADLHPQPPGARHRHGAVAAGHLCGRRRALR